MMTSEFPDDEDGQALKIMAERGMNMTMPAKFEFSIHVENEKDSKIVAERLEAAGLGDGNEIVYDEGELEEGEEMIEENEEFWPSWTVYVYQSMLPNYVEVVGFQQRLAKACQECGKPDGWTVRVS